MPVGYYVKVTRFSQYRNCGFEFSHLCGTDAFRNPLRPGVKWKALWKSYDFAQLALSSDLRWALHIYELRL